MKASTPIAMGLVALIALAAPAVAQGQPATPPPKNSA